MDELKRIRATKLRNEGTALEESLLWSELMAWFQKRLDYHNSVTNSKGLFDQRAICLCSQSQGALTFAGELLNALKKLTSGQSI